jgi:hypothetical protein
MTISARTADETRILCFPYFLRLLSASSLYRRALFYAAAAERLTDDIHPRFYTTPSPMLVRTNRVGHRANGDDPINRNHGTNLVDRVRKRRPIDRF